MATNNALNAPIPFAVSKGGTGQASLTDHGILIGKAAANILPIVLANGQILIGSTGFDPVATTITAGTGISIVNGIGTITVNAMTSLTWNDVTTGSQSLAVQNGYITNNGASLVTYTLPVTAAQGTEIKIAGFSAGGWTIAQNASQQIRYGNVLTTVGVAGSLSSADQGDQVSLLCVTANLTWVVLNTQGNITYL